MSGGGGGGGVMEQSGEHVPINLCPRGEGALSRGGGLMNLCPEGVGSIVRGACGNKPVSRGGREHFPGGMWQ